MGATGLAPGPRYPRLEVTPGGLAPDVLSLQVFADADPKYNEWRGSVPHRDVTTDPFHACWKGLEE